MPIFAAAIDEQLGEPPLTLHSALNTLPIHHSHPPHFPKDSMEPRADIPVFLDFEGVLRPAHTTAGLTQARHLVAPLRHAESLGLRPLLVISSTHRLDYHVEQLSQILESHAKGLGRFVAGSTPYAGRMRMADEDHEFYALAPRLFETRAWIASRPQPFPAWIAIDDNENIYQHPEMPLPPELLLCDGRHGFTPADADQLASRFDRIAAQLDKRPAP